MPEPVAPQTATISPGSSREVDAAQHLGARAVGEADVLEADAERAVGERPRLRRLGQRLDLLEPGEAAACRCHRTLAEVDDPAERLERPHELQQQRHEEHQLAERERARR